MFVQFVFFIFTCDANQHIFFSQLVSYSRAKTQTRIAKEHFTARRVVLQLVAVASQEYESAQSHQVCRGVSHVQTFSHEVHHAFDHRVGHVGRDVSGRQC